MIRNYVCKTQRGKVSEETVLLAVMQVTQYKRSLREVSKEFNIPRKTLGRYCIAKRSPSTSNSSVQTEAIHECQAFPLISKNDIICEFYVNAKINKSVKVTKVRDLLSSDKSDKKPWNKFGYAKRFQVFSLSLTSSNMI